jgi:thioredoxin-related protein
MDAVHISWRAEGFLLTVDNFMSVLVYRAREPKEDAKKQAQVQRQVMADARLKFWENIAKRFVIHSTPSSFIIDIIGSYLFV